MGTDSKLPTTVNLPADLIERAKKQMEKDGIDNFSEFTRDALESHLDEIGDVFSLPRLLRGAGKKLDVFFKQNSEDGRGK